MNRFNNARLIFFVIFCLFFTSCTGIEKKDEDVLYAETNVSPFDHGQYAIAQTKEEDFISLNKQLDRFMKSNADATTWTTMTTYKNLNSDDELEYRKGMDCLSNGSMILFVKNKGIFLLSESGAFKFLSIPSIEQYIKDSNIKVSLDFLNVVSDTRLFIKYEIDNVSKSTIETKQSLIDLTSGEEIATYHTDELLLDVTSDSTFFYALSENLNIKTYHISDGKLSNEPRIELSKSFEKLRLSDSSAAYGSALCLDQNGNFIVLQNNEIYSITKGGLVSLVFNGDNYNIGAHFNDVHNIFVMKDGSYLINLSNEYGDSVSYCYKIDNDEKKATLKIWSLYENQYVNAAIAQHRINYPEIKLELQIAIYDPHNNSMNPLDAIKQLNASILSNNGPDIILLDGIPINSYINKGLLMPLDEFVNTDELFENIITSSKHNGKLYYLTTNFIAPVLAGEEDNLKKINKFEDLLELLNKSPIVERAQIGDDSATNIPSPLDNGKRDVIYFHSLNELLEVIGTNAQAVLVQDEGLNTEILRELLVAVKKINDKLDLSSHQNDPYYFEIKYPDKEKYIQSSLYQLACSQSDYAAFLAKNIGDLVIPSMNKFQIKPFPGVVDGVWLPVNQFGVASDTKNREYAIDFLQTTIHVSLQRSNASYGFPVSKSGFGAQLDQLNNYLIALDQEPLTSFDIDAFVTKLTIQANTDLELFQLIISPLIDNSAAFLREEESIDKVLEKSEKNAKIYFAERR